MSPVHRTSPTEYSSRRSQRFAVEFHERAMSGLFTPTVAPFRSRAVAELALRAPCKATTCAFYQMFTEIVRS
jgi:hypothetical protein